MKLIYYNIISLFLFSIITSCSGGDSGSGGSDSPLPQNNISGVWELTELEYNGIDLMPEYSQAWYNFHPNGEYEFEGYLTRRRVSRD